VIGVDPVKERCALARRVGIESVVDAPPDQQVEAVKERTGGQGARVTVDAAGHSAVIANCVKATALFGQVVLVGSPRAPVEGNLTEILSLVHTNGLVVRGAHMWRYPVRGDRNVARSVEWVFATAFDLIARRQLNVRDLISHVIRPEEAPAAYAGLQSRPSEYTGVVIDWR
jgi:threonine dehydrogenase-like Zn-dependent dehydrogenase